MSVFTCVHPADAKDLLLQFDIGGLANLQGIASGIENTNYFLDTTQQRYVLTLFERLGVDELPFFLRLMRHLAQQDIPCPCPIANRDGELLQQVCGKPASLVSRLSGHSLETPQIDDCVQVGATLARLHLAGQNFPEQRANPRSSAWWKALLPQLLPHLNDVAGQMLQEEIRFQGLHRLQDLPRGIIHADLFRDNVLFENGKLSGIIDFYFACTDTFLYDLAITVNDWCIISTAAPNEVKVALDMRHTQQLLHAYHAVRPLTALERGAWPVVLRAAALRFWVSRLHDLHFPRSGELTHAKDPEHFRQLLRWHIDHASLLRSVWIN